MESFWFQGFGMFLGLGVGVCGFLGLGRLRSEFLGFWVGIRDHAFRVQGFELCSLYFQFFPDVRRTGSAAWHTLPTKDTLLAISRHDW